MPLYGSVDRRIGAAAAVRPVTSIRRCELLLDATVISSKMLGGASQIVSMIRVKWNGKRKLTCSTRTASSLRCCVS